MATSRAIKPKRDDHLLQKWESMPERAPSIVREESPTIARVAAMVGLFLLVLGLLAMLAPLWQERAVISTGAGFFLASLGLGPLIYHSLVERDVQFRRLYAYAGLALILVGVVLRLIIFRSGSVQHFFYYGVPGLLLGLILLVAVIRNETDASFRTFLMNILGGMGALIIVFSLVNGSRNVSGPGNLDYLPGEVALMLNLGLLYVGGYIALQDPASDRGYRAGLGLGAIGVIAFAIGLVRSVMPESTFLVPSGLILMGMGLVYFSVALGICADWPILVLTRRELAAYLFSPVAYLVFIGQLILGWAMFMFFVYGRVLEGNLLEPIVSQYIFSIIPVIVQMFFVPALTMRLLSEEKRSGTLEVLLTAPVNEISVVLGKFFACWILYMLLWLPTWLFLVALRYMGNEPFDYRPILSFTIALAAISAGLLAMGLFFSSLTTNQLIAAVFTFVGMMSHLVLYFMEYQFGRPGTALTELLGYVNFLDFWDDSLRGTIAPRFFIFHLSVAVFFLFATVKVLESRKWK